MLHAKSMCLAFCAQALHGYILNARYIYMVYPSKILRTCDANPPIRNWPFSYFNYHGQILVRKQNFHSIIFSLCNLQTWFSNFFRILDEGVSLERSSSGYFLFYLYVYICTDVQIFIGIYIHTNVPTCTCKINVYGNIFII